MGGIFTLATVFLSPTEWVIRGALALVFAAGAYTRPLIS